MIGVFKDGDNPTEIPIRRYVKGKSDANPFDVNWRGYFETRKRFR
jgi:RNA-directed DNA polymerase